jgi:hypothetical protein
MIVKESKKGDLVSLPFGERGVIVNVDNRLWGYRYLVKITHATLSEVGEEADFKAEQLAIDRVEI